MRTASRYLMRRGPIFCVLWRLLTGLGWVAILSWLRIVKGIDLTTQLTEAFQNFAIGSTMPITPPRSEISESKPESLRDGNTIPNGGDPHMTNGYNQQKNGEANNPNRNHQTTTTGARGSPSPTAVVGATGASTLLSRLKLRHLKDSNPLSFIDESGREILLKGTSVVVKGPPYYLPDIKEYSAETSLMGEDFSLMRQMGLNLVRLGVVWTAAQPEKLKFDMNYFSRINTIVKTASHFGIYILVEMHQECLSEKMCGFGLPDWITADITPNDVVKQTESIFETFAGAVTGDTDDHGKEKMDSKGEIDELSYPFPLAKAFDRRWTPSITNGEVRGRYPSKSQCMTMAEKNYHQLTPCYVSYDVSRAFQHVYDSHTEDWGRFLRKMATTLLPNKNFLGIQLINEPWLGDPYNTPMFPAASHPDIAEYLIEKTSVKPTENFIAAHQDESIRLSKDSSIDKSYLRRTISNVVADMRFTWEDKLEDDLQKEKDRKAEAELKRKIEEEKEKLLQVQEEQKQQEEDREQREEEHKPQEEDREQREEEHKTQEEDREQREEEHKPQEEDRERGEDEQKQQEKKDETELGAVANLEANSKDDAGKDDGDGQSSMLESALASSMLYINTRYADTESLENPSPPVKRGNLRGTSRNFHETPAVSFLEKPPAVSTPAVSTLEEGNKQVTSEEPDGEQTDTESKNKKKGVTEEPHHGGHDRGNQKTPEKSVTAPVGQSTLQNSMNSLVTPAVQPQPGNAAMVRPSAPGTQVTQLGQGAGILPSVPAGVIPPQVVSPVIGAMTGQPSVVPLPASEPWSSWIGQSLSSLQENPIMTTALGLGAVGAGSALAYGLGNWGGGVASATQPLLGPGETRVWGPDGRVIMAPAKPAGPPGPIQSLMGVQIATCLQGIMHACWPSIFLQTARGKSPSLAETARNIPSTAPTQTNQHLNQHVRDSGGTLPAFHRSGGSASSVGTQIPFTHLSFGDLVDLLLPEKIDRTVLMPVYDVVAEQIRGSDIGEGDSIHEESLQNDLILFFPPIRWSNSIGHAPNPRGIAKEIQNSEAPMESKLGLSINPIPRKEEEETSFVSVENNRETTHIENVGDKIENARRNANIVERSFLEGTKKNPLNPLNLHAVERSFLEGFLKEFLEEDSVENSVLNREEKSVLNQEDSFLSVEVDHDATSFLQKSAFQTAKEKIKHAFGHSSARCCSGNRKEDESKEGSKEGMDNGEVPNQPPGAAKNGEVGNAQVGGNSQGAVAKPGDNQQGEKDGDSNKNGGSTNLFSKIEESVVDSVSEAASTAAEKSLAEVLPDDSPLNPPQKDTVRRAGFTHVPGGVENLKETLVKMVANTRNDNADDDEMTNQFTKTGTQIVKNPARLSHPNIQAQDTMSAVQGQDTMVSSTKKKSETESLSVDGENADHSSADTNFLKQNSNKLNEKYRFLSAYSVRYDNYGLGAKDFVGEYALGNALRLGTGLMFSTNSHLDTFDRFSVSYTAFQWKSFCRERKDAIVVGGGTDTEAGYAHNNAKNRPILHQKPPDSASKDETPYETSTGDLPTTGTPQPQVQEKRGNLRGTNRNAQKAAANANPGQSAAGRGIVGDQSGITIHHAHAVSADDPSIPQKRHHASQMAHHASSMSKYMSPISKHVSSMENDASLMGHHDFPLGGHESLKNRFDAIMAAEGSFLETKTERIGFDYNPNLDFPQWGEFGACRDGKIALRKAIIQPSNNLNQCLLFDLVRMRPLKVSGVLVGEVNVMIHNEQGLEVKSLKQIPGEHQCQDDALSADGHSALYDLVNAISDKGTRQILETDTRRRNEELDKLENKLEKSFTKKRGKQENTNRPKETAEKSGKKPMVNSKAEPQNEEYSLFQNLFGAFTASSFIQKVRHHFQSPPHDPQNRNGENPSPTTTQSQNLAGPAGEGNSESQNTVRPAAEASQQQVVVAQGEGDLGCSGSGCVHQGDNMEQEKVEEQKKAQEGEEIQRGTDEPVDQTETDNGQPANRRTQKEKKKAPKYRSGPKPLPSLPQGAPQVVAPGSSQEAEDESSNGESDDSAYERAAEKLPNNEYETDFERLGNLRDREAQHLHNRFARKRIMELSSKFKKDLRMTLDFTMTLDTHPMFDNGREASSKVTEVYLGAFADFIGSTFSPESDLVIKVVPDNILEYDFKPQSLAEGIAPQSVPGSVVNSPSIPGSGVAAPLQPQSMLQAGSLPQPGPPDSSSGTPHTVAVGPSNASKMITAYDPDSMILSLRVNDSIHRALVAQLADAKKKGKDGGDKILVSVTICRKMYMR